MQTCRFGYGIYNITTNIRRISHIGKFSNVKMIFILATYG